jgi:hypothetical protein
MIFSKPELSTGATNGQSRLSKIGEDHTQQVTFTYMFSQSLVINMLKTCLCRQSNEQHTGDYLL